MWRPEISIRRLSSTFLRQDLLLYLECIDLAELAGQWVPGIHLTPSFQIWVYSLDLMPSFYVGSGDLNSSPHNLPDRFFTDSPVSSAPGVGS